MQTKAPSPQTTMKCQRSSNSSFDEKRVLSHGKGAENYHTLNTIFMLTQSSIPVIQSGSHYLDTSETPLLVLPVDIILLIYDQLSTYDAICLALTSTTLYNLARRRLSGVICPRHLGGWAGKRLAWIDDTMNYRSTFKKYPVVGESLKKSQRVMKASIPKRGGYIGIPKKEIDTPFKLVEKFPNRLPWNSRWEYDPVAADVEETANLDEEEVRKYRTRTLGPEFRRMQSLWYQWQSGQLYLPLPIRRFVEGFIGRDMGMSLLTDDSYVLRNLDKCVFVQLDGRDVSSQLCFCTILLFFFSLPRKCMLTAPRRQGIW